MKIPRFFQDNDFQISDVEIPLSPSNHRHVIQVLRMKQQEKLIIFNGRGGEFHASLSTIDKRKSFIKIESFSDISRESNLKLTLVLAMIKPEKIDFAIQKAVELGITHIQPLYTERSVIKIKANRLDKKMQHWQGIIIAACEQSGRTIIPKILEPTTLQHCVETYSVNSHCIAMLPGENPKINQLDYLNMNQALSLFVGPEGGFTQDEEKQILEKGIIPISFGTRILRAETAAIAGITACQQHWGDL